MTPTKQVVAEKFSFVSSLPDDIWHQQTGNKAYQWAYFDALSDDGRDALIITFYDNFVFSPRYNSSKNQKKVPAVAFCYYRNGKPIYRTLNEFCETDFVSAQPRLLEKLAKTFSNLNLRLTEKAIWLK